jgi:hypothetical protein
MTSERAKSIASILVVADQIETEKTMSVGETFEDAAVVYCAGLNATREEIREVMDTKLREILGRDD